MTKREAEIVAAETDVLEAVENRMGHFAAACGCAVCDASLVLRQLSGLDTPRGRRLLREWRAAREARR